MYQKLKDIFEKKELTAEDKLFVVECGKRLDMPFVKRGNCKNCYSDHAFKMLSSIKGNKKPAKSVEYFLDPKLKIDVILKGVRINAETLDEKKAKMLIKAGFSRWFSKMPK